MYNYHNTINYQNTIRGISRADSYEQRKMEWHRKRAVEIARARLFIAVGLTVAVILFSILIGGFIRDINASEAGRTAHRCYTNVTVEKGDTLWGIASEYTDGSNAAVRACVDEIRSINDIGFYDSICSGDKLIVPYTVYE